MKLITTLALIASLSVAWADDDFGVKSNVKKAPKMSKEAQKALPATTLIEVSEAEAKRVIKAAQEGEFTSSPQTDAVKGVIHSDVNISGNDTQKKKTVSSIVKGSRPVSLDPEQATVKTSEGVRVVDNEEVAAAELGDSTSSWYFSYRYYSYSYSAYYRPTYCYRGVSYSQSYTGYYQVGNRWFLSFGWNYRY